MGDEQPFDDRHNTPPQGPKISRPFESTLTDAAERIEAFKGSELSFSLPGDSRVITRLGRTSRAEFDRWETVDLLTLEAHLSHAARVVRLELSRRGTASSA